MAESSSSTGLIVPHKAVLDDSTELWPEPLYTSGLIPRHLKRAATTQFPILEVLQRLLYRLKPSGGDLEKVLALIGLYQAASPICHYLKEILAWAFTVQITIPETDPVAKDILAWIGSEVMLGSSTRSVMLMTGGNQEVNGDLHRHWMMPGGQFLNSYDQNGSRVLCLPPIGTRLFWVGYRPFVFLRRGGRGGQGHNSGAIGGIADDNGYILNSVTIMTLGWKLDPLQRFTDLCHEFKRQHTTGTTTVYFIDGDNDVYTSGWKSASKAIRKLETIDMDPEVKSDIIKDAEYYYSDESCQFFADCGIPYRRGYLFHGPPGTGKSSFSAALAGHLGCNIYQINLSTGDISDGTLHSLFLSLPRKCIVVIEDIDSAGIGRDHVLSARPRGLEAMPQNAPGASIREERRNRVTLSGLLNAIDGNASQEGRLLIMTSNNPDALDAALTRPGRIDKKVYFGNMSKRSARSIFKRLAGRSALVPDAAFTMPQIEQYAIEFAEKVPDDTFTPAQVQNFLQSCRGDPLQALAGIEAWVREQSGHSDASSRENASGDASDAVVVNSVTSSPRGLEAL